LNEIVSPLVDNIIENTRRNIVEDCRLLFGTPKKSPGQIVRRIVDAERIASYSNNPNRQIIQRKTMAGHYVMNANADNMMYGEWSTLADFHRVLRVLQRTNFSVGSQRENALMVMNTMAIPDPIFGPDVRFPQFGTFIYLYDTEIARKISVLRSVLGIKDRHGELSVRTGNAAHGATSATTHVNENMDASVSFYKQLNELVVYLRAIDAKFNRDRFEREIVPWTV